MSTEPQSSAPAATGAGTMPFERPGDAELADARRRAQASEACLHAVLQTTTDAIVCADEAGRVTLFNPAAETLFGRTEAETIGRPLTELMPERYRAAHAAGLARHLATGEGRVIGHRLELEALHSSGAEIPVELTLSAHHLGGRGAFTAVIRDIGDRVAAQQELRAADERFTEAFGGAAMGMALVSPEGRFIRANRALAELTGYTQHELGHLRFTDLVHPDERAALETAIAAMVAQRTDRYAGEHRWVHRTGEVAHLRSHVAVIRDGAGRAKHLVASLEDVTERRRMLEALTLSEARYRALVENLPDTIITLFDADLRLLVVEGGGLERLGTPVRNLEGRRLREAIGEEHAPGVETHYRAALLGEARSFDHEDVAGTTWWTQVVPLHDEAARVIGGMAVWRDVSQRKAAERALEDRARELERSNAELEQFAYIASHDLAEPLRMVTSYLQLLERRYAGSLDADAREFIHFAVDGAARMRTLIDDLLAYSRVGRGDRPFERVEVSELVTRVAETLTAGREGPPAAIEVGDLPPVSGDAQQLGQLFQNLIGNALKFTPADRPPRVEVRAERLDPGWRFTVADNGIGIDPQHADRIFRMFQRLHARDEYPGTGVGLAIARKVVERHGGRIWAEPRPEGGTRFCFELPGDGT